MGIGLKDHKLLWGRGGNRCAICKVLLVIDENELDAESLVGEEAHIIAQKPDGPRGEFQLSVEERDKYSNLLLLCRNHHKEVDDQCSTYTVEKLHQIKRDHEAWVQQTLDAAFSKKLKDDLLYIDIITEWERLMDLDEWQRWTSNWLCGGGDPQMTKEDRDRLHQAKEFIFKRIWPGTNEALESSFNSFRWILNDLLRFFANFSAPSRHDPNVLEFEKGYKNGDYNPNYDRLLREHRFYVDFFEDLVFELTRAANRICDVVRESIQPQYRREKGALIVVRGPNMRLEFTNHRAEYQSGEEYRGLLEFYQDRKGRDISVFNAEDTEPERLWH